MSALKTIGVISLVGLSIWAYNAARNRVGFKIKGYGFPEWNGTSSINLPIKVEFRNPSPVRVNVDRVVVNVHLWKNNQWVNVAHIDRQISIEAGNHVVEIKPTIQLASILADLFGTLVNISQAKKIYTRTEVTATFAGITFPTQIYEDTIDLV